YGSLGHLKPLKDRNPAMRVVVAGCLAQKDQGEIHRRAPWVDVVIGTHALPGLLDLLRRAEAEGPQMDVREYTEVFPSALPARRATCRCGRGPTPSCGRCGAPTAATGTSRGSSASGRAFPASPSPPTSSWGFRVRPRQTSPPLWTSSAVQRSTLRSRFSIRPG